MNEHAPEQKQESQKELEEKPLFIAYVFLVRKYGGTDVHVAQVVGAHDVAHIKPHTLRNFAAAQKCNREGYHLLLQQRFLAQPIDAQRAAEELVQEWMRKNAAHKYWQYEPAAAAIALEHLQKNGPAGYGELARALSLHFDSAVTAGTLREAIKHTGVETMKARLAASAATLSFDERAASVAHAKEAEQRSKEGATTVRSPWAYYEDGTPHTLRIALAAALHESGMSAKGIALVLAALSSTNVKAVTIKKFFQTPRSAPALSAAQQQWVKSAVEEATKWYEAQKYGRNKGRMLTIPSFQEEAFLRTYAPVVAAQARRVTSDPIWADDVTQRAMERLMQAHRKGRIKERSNIAGYIYTMCKNIVRDDARTKKRKNEVLTDPQTYMIQNVPAVPEEEISTITDLDQERLQKALSTLPPEQREVLRLRFFEERTQEEIAEALSIPLGTCKGRMRLAFEKLRAELSREDFEESF